MKTTDATAVFDFFRQLAQADERPAPAALLERLAALFAATQIGVGARAQERGLEQAAVVTSRLSHDFGNFLTGIMGFTELSLSQAPLDSTLHKYLDEVLQSAKQGADWIRRLQGFCRRSSAPA